MLHLNRYLVCSQSDGSNLGFGQWFPILILATCQGSSYLTELIDGFNPKLASINLQRIGAGSDDKQCDGQQKTLSQQRIHTTTIFPLLSQGDGGWGVGGRGLSQYLNQSTWSNVPTAVLQSRCRKITWRPGAHKVHTNTQRGNLDMVEG